MGNVVLPRTIPQCNFKVGTLERDWSSFLVQWYSGDGYDGFDGIYLTPHNHGSTQNYTKWALLPEKAVTFQHAFCKQGEQDGSTWNVQKVGPFISFGGYDWWKMAGHDVGRLAVSVTKNRHIFVLETMLGAADSSGELIPYPPIHNHHIHVNPEQDCLRFEDPRCYSIDYVFERHGEWGPGFSYSEVEIEGYGRDLTFPLVLDAEINDARPAQSPEMCWHMVFAFRWTTKHRKPVSYVRFFVPNFFFREGARLDPWAHQGVREAYFFVPTSGQFVNWYNSTYNGPEGKLLYVKGHNHHNLLVKSFIFGIAAAELGVTCPEFCSARHRFEAHIVPLMDTSYSTFFQLESSLQHRARQVPNCTLFPNYLVNQEVAYDRAPTVQCSPWVLRPGADVSSVTFLHYHPAQKLEPWLQNLPSSLPMHSNWFFAIETDVSCYLTIYNAGLFSSGKCAILRDGSDARLWLVLTMALAAALAARFVLGLHYKSIML